MTVKDLTIGSPVYRVGLDQIEISRVRLLEAYKDGTRRIELENEHSCTEKVEASEIETESRYCIYKTHWFLNISDAELAQLMCRSEHIEKLKKEMERTQNEFAEAVQKYAFSEPSTPKEM